MAHKMLRSEFLGQTLERGSQLTPSKLPAQQQTQALLGKNKGKQAKQAPKQALDKLKGATQQVRKQAPKKGGGLSLPKAPKVPSLPKAAPKAPSPQRAQKTIQKALPKRGGGGGRGSKGWFGGVGGVAGTKGLGKYYGPDRDLFLPGGLLDREDVPSYLNGTLAGDYGYDPLGLGRDPAALDKYQFNEVFHARWAMLAAAGIIIPEGLQANGADLRGGTWFETGAEMLNGGTLNYFAVPWAIINNPLPLVVVIAIEVVLVGAVEQFRGKGEGPPGYAPGVGQFDSSIFNSLDSLYPGGPFDPLGLADDPEVFQELKVKEIKNGRLAMISVLGFAAQGYVTGEGPYANWAKHVSDPFGYNLLTILGSEDRLPTL